MDLTSMYCLPTAKRKTTQTPLLNVLLTSRRNPKQNKIPNSLQPMVSVLNISCLKYLTMIVHLGKETPKWHFSFSVDLLKMASGKIISRSYECWPLLSLFVCVITVISTVFFSEKSKAFMSEQLLNFSFMLYYLNDEYIC